MFGVAVKIFYVGRLGFFVRAQRSCVSADTGIFSIAWKEKRSPSSEKKFYSPILIEKNFSRRRSGKMADRGLNKKLRRMTPIEHFLKDIIQIIFRDIIEITIADIGHCKAATDIFQPTLRNFFTSTGR